MKTSLNFSWEFVDEFKLDYLSGLPKNKQVVDIPHNAVSAGSAYLDEASYQKKVTYAKTFEFKGTPKYAYLVFEGVMVQFDLYLNDVSLGHFISGYLPVKVDVASHLVQGKNRILVIVDGKEDPTIPPFGGEVDYLTGSGIYRPVYLETHEGPYVNEIFVQAKANGSLHLDYYVVGQATPEFELYDADKRLAKFSGNDFTLQDVIPYSLENPHLYTLVATIGNEEKKVRFGFRDVAFTLDGFFLNGKKVFLRGLNRHQLFPYNYGAMPKYFQEEDARILKEELGCNIVRTSHYPQSEDFLNKCDELGLLVIDEIPGWQYIGKDKPWRDNLLDFTARMIKKERNHPSLIAYGLRIDESKDDHDLYTQVQAKKAELDPTRPSLGVRNFKESECLEDIYAYNDFSCEDLSHGADDPASWKGAEGKAKLITESNGHMFPTATYDPTDRRIEHALRHARVLNDAMGQKGLCGALSWCAFDYPTHDHFGNLDHICHHGVMDQYRTKKPAAYFYQSQSDDKPVLYLASSLQSSDYNAAMLPAGVVFTNADEIEVSVSGEKIGTFYPDREHYPNLPHPPIIIDDWIGERFKEENISPKDAKTIIAGLNESAQKGANHLSLGTKLKMGYLMMKYHYSYTDVYNLYGKYINHWGKVGNDVYTIIAKKGGKEVSRIQYASPRLGKLIAYTSKPSLKNGDTYDGCYLCLEKRDVNGNLCHKAFDPYTIEVEGPIRLMGPHIVSLEGGATRIGIASVENKKPGTAKVFIKGQGEELVLQIEVL